ncbi:hypothetical protein DCS32_09370 [Dokdonia sp. Dokd-P16]|uniref:hypothetical protein n=1 Tax=Dokdonia sp. Dokd-P16 TaxID=2173169 RepID=UPI000D5462B3|nr:hypothetical protein [Dokdonia sp. Dokd-P16]AWH74360.1 hypothetical protein DCS32_09370 [Dokdonia sp. Dokd-P16]
MKQISLYITACFLLVVAFAKAQSLNPQLLLKLNEATTAELNSMTGVEAGAMAYDSDLKIAKFYDGTSWQEMNVPARGSIILNRNGGSGILTTANNTYFDMPINSSHIQANEGGLFTVVDTGKVRIEQDGVYAISASLSTSNMPVGNTKYILAARRNNSLIGYLSRGSVTLTGQDYWGSSGTITYSLSAGDVINFQYVINAGGASLNAVFTNASITKL